MAKRNEAPGTHPNMLLTGRCFPAALSPVPGTTCPGPTALLTVRARRGLWSGGSQHRPASPSVSSASQPSQSSWCHRPRWWRSRCRSASCCPQRSGWDKPAGGEPKTPAGPGGRSAACNPHWGKRSGPKRTNWLTEHGPVEEKGGKSVLTTWGRHREGQVTGRDTGYRGGTRGTREGAQGRQPSWGAALHHCCLQSLAGEGPRRGWDPSLPTSLGGMGPALAQRGSPAQHPAGPAPLAPSQGCLVPLWTPSCSWFTSRALIRPSIHLQPPFYRPNPSVSPACLLAFPPPSPPKHPPTSTRPPP